MKIINPPLGKTSLPDFLQHYWQRKPLLIRNAIANYHCPISADEMAGLACEAEVESRIILERNGDHPWQCQHGPFEEAFFSQLPETHWTLLLQSCNIFIPEFAQLLERFRFIPNWRVDDIMVSYAPEGGSVGPHTDNYDVFLLQAQGKRRWEISTQAFGASDFYPDLDLKILKSFSAEQSWQLEAGDMLYLPPGVAHHGVALDDCMTVSIGFRAPNYAELSTALLDECLSQPSTDSNNLFYQDPDIPLQENPGEISDWAIRRVNNIVRQELNSQLQLGDWFGKYITATPLAAEPLTSPLNEQQCLQQLKAGIQLVRNETSKLAFFVDKENKIHFFSNGNVIHFPLEFLAVISIVCNYRYPPLDLLIDSLGNSKSRSFLCNLVNEGHFYYQDEYGEDL